MSKVDGSAFRSYRIWIYSHIRTRTEICDENNNRKQNGFVTMSRNQVSDDKANRGKMQTRYLFVPLRASRSRYLPFSITLFTLECSKNLEIYGAAVAMHDERTTYDDRPSRINGKLTSGKSVSQSQCMTSKRHIKTGWTSPKSASKVRREAERCVRVAFVFK